MPRTGFPTASFAPTIAAGPLRRFIDTGSRTWGWRRTCCEATPLPGLGSIHPPSTGRAASAPRASDSRPRRERGGDVPADDHGNRTAVPDLGDEVDGARV